MLYRRGLRRAGVAVKQVVASRRMMGRYLKKHRRVLCCAKCDRPISVDEKVAVTTHHIHYYCSDCAKKIEI